MRIEITIPTAGESLTEGDIAHWHKKTGDPIQMDDPLLDFETDKASLEIAAEADGLLTITEEEGATVRIGQVVGYIDTDNGDQQTRTLQADEVGPLPEAATHKTAETAAQKTLKEKLHAGAKTEEKTETDAEPPDENDEPNADNLSQVGAPAVRKLMAEHGISAQDIHGTGKDGRITKADVRHFIEETTKIQELTPRETDDVAPAAKTPDSEPARREESETTAQAPAARPQPDDADAGRGTRVENMTRLRRTIAQRLVDAQQTAALLTTFNEVDMSAIMDVRKAHKEEFKEKHNVGLGFMSFFTNACTGALQQFPVVNAAVKSDTIVFHDYCDIGIAVSTPKGLVVPIIRNAEMLTFHEIESTIAELAGRGRDGELSIDDLTGGTFTITNGGIFGSMLSTPIVNPPQSAILGMHNIVERPVVCDGEVVVRPIMYVALTYDHRIIDGSEAVTFLVTVKKALEDPNRLLLNL